MNDPYAKFQDAYLFEQENKPKAVQVLMDAQARGEAQRLLERFRNRPAYLKAITTEIVKEVLLNSKDEDTPQNA